jgi:hypothetical protein
MSSACRGKLAQRWLQTVHPEATVCGSTDSCHVHAGAQELPQAQLDRRMIHNGACEAQRLRNATNCDELVGYECSGSGCKARVHMHVGQLTVRLH